MLDQDQRHLAAAPRAKLDALEQATRMRAAGTTCQQIGDALGMSDSWVHKWTPKSGKPYKLWTEQEEDRLRRLRTRKQPATYKHIAKLLGRGERECRLKWCRMRKTDRQDEAKLAVAVGYMLKAVQLGCPPSRAITAVRKADVIMRGNEMPTPDRFVYRPTRGGE